MYQKFSCLLALGLAVGSALVTVPSHAQTAAETNNNITVSAQSSVSRESIISKLKKSKTVKISQSEPSSTTANTEELERENPVYSRIGWLKQ